MTGAGPNFCNFSNLFARRAGRLTGALALAALVSACGAEPPPELGAPEVSPQKVEKAQAAAAELGKRLKSRLMESMGSEGPVAAIRVCSEEAPEIAREVSADAGLTVSRTSLKTRNPDNAPDARERAVLELWRNKVDAGTPAAALEPFASDGGAFLWMKPILVEPPCLMCHGSDVPEAVADAIAKRYPQDRATGYSAGDLRGAFVVR
ncbi:Tll0287-like domain-containing protein [Lentisalinibacter salinarum]|uniref:Tll0287-like domain-containing protein n=1 Tax=Lentisalinibacter salinarum TaxID=2992239 RepID=UPI003868AEBD